MSNAGPRVPNYASGHVLVVDDEPRNRLLLRSLLKAQGHRVSEAENGEQALQIVLEDPPDAVLLDVMMPGMDGLQVCREIKGNPETAHIPVLLVTALHDRTDRLAGIAAGANDFLTKPIDTKDVPLRVRNVVYTKHLFDRLQKSYCQLQALEQLRDNLTQMIVHDLRTPLTSVLTGLYTIQAMGGLSAQQGEIVEMAMHGGRALLGMINDLLDISKMEDGTLKLETSRSDPRALLRRALEHIEPLAKEKRLGIVERTEIDLPPIEVDVSMFERTLVNLLGNAVKFTPGGGQVTISLRPSERKDAVLFAVSDTGEGIPAEAFDRIFEKFGQVESRRAGRSMSTGLGLTFCKMAIEAHGGRIWVESQIGKGSTFRFTVPAIPGDQDRGHSHS